MIQKLILEKCFGFNQRQNLTILTISLLLILFGMLNANDHDSFLYYEILLSLLILIFVAILNFKKGLISNDQVLYKAVFLAGFVMKQTEIELNSFHRISIFNSRLSTNYDYMPEKKTVGNWEPNLNVSVKIFSIILIDDIKFKNKEIMYLLNRENALLAVDFITKNTKFNDNQI
jgi:hypothetical protein